MKKYQFSITLVLFFLGVNLSACKNETEPITDNNNNNTTTVDTVFCATDASYKFGEYIIVNNCWGKGTITSFTQCSYVKQTDAETNMGFNWSWPSNVNNNVKAYPEIVFGHKPWNTTSTTPLLPVQVTTTKSIIASFTSITTTFGGVGNTAFDIWITASSAPSSSNIKREIMIWTKNFGQGAGGSKIASVTIDNVLFDLYKADWDWTYLAFVNKNNTEMTTVNIHKFIKYLLENNHITSSEFIAAIEFGNEIISGTGSTNIKNYKVTVE